MYQTYPLTTRVHKMASRKNCAKKMKTSHPAHPSAHPPINFGKVIIEGGKVVGSLITLFDYVNKFHNKSSLNAGGTPLLVDGVGWGFALVNDFSGLDKNYPDGSICVDIQTITEATKFTRKATFLIIGGLGPTSQVLAKFDLTFTDELPNVLLNLDRDFPALVEPDGSLKVMIVVNTTSKTVGDKYH